MVVVGKLSSCILPIVEIRFVMARFGSSMYEEVKSAFCSLSLKTEQFLALYSLLFLVSPMLQCFVIFITAYVGRWSVCPLDPWSCVDMTPQHCVSVFMLSRTWSMRVADVCVTLVGRTCLNDVEMVTNCDKFVQLILK